MEGMMMSNQVTITLSDDLTMAYVQFAKGKVKRTLDLTDDLNLDLDANDKVIGLEYLSLEAVLPEQRLIEEFHLDAKVVHKLRHGLSA